MEQPPKKLYKTKEDNKVLKVGKEISDIKTSFLKFMIEQNPNFAEIDKLEQEYKNEIKSNFEKINVKTTKIKNRKDRIQALETQIIGVSKQ